MNYAEARDTLSGKLAFGYARKLVKPNPWRTRVKIANNTYLERRADTVIALVLHSTDVVTFTPHYAELRTGGWHTMTTANRLSMGPCGVGSGSNGWAVYTSSLQACYCVTDGAEHYPQPIRGEQETGKRPTYTGERDADGNPIFEWRTCSACQGSGKLVRPDNNGGHPFFEGIRVRNDGTGILKTQPNRPARLSPVKTERGFMYGY
jgi:hypothetical protein